MQKFGVAGIREIGASETAWRRLRRFHDVSLASARVMSARRLPEKQRKNVNKQMEQMSYCLTQAWEFVQSARASGLATKALQAYYAITALANAEVLWRGDGDVSFDRRPNISNRHGLDLSKSDDGQIDNFCASPQIVGGKEAGLFGLWRQYSQHLPLVAMITQFYSGETSESGHRVIGGATPLSNAPMLESLSLRDCFACIPAMKQRPSSPEVLARGRAEVTLHYSQNGSISRQVQEMIVHPCSEAMSARMGERFAFHPALTPFVDVKQPRSGWIFKVQVNELFDFYEAPFPEVFQQNDEMGYFISVPEYECLNEFGYFYIGLYILGMIARYHPQTWIKPLQRNEAITLVVEEFLDLALDRMPLLTLAQIENRVYLYE